MRRGFEEAAQPTELIGRSPNVSGSHPASDQVLAADQRSRRRCVATVGRRVNPLTDVGVKGAWTWNRTGVRPAVAAEVSALLKKPCCCEITDVVITPTLSIEPSAIEHGG